MSDLAISGRAASGAPKSSSCCRPFACRVGVASLGGEAGAHISRGAPRP